MKGGSSIYEVAKAAGVSITTVSHALNDKGRMADETRERVQRIAAEFDYYPHAGARRLAGMGGGLMGLAVPQTPAFSFSLTDFAYFTQVMAASTTRALERGYALILVPVILGEADPFRRFEVDGAIVVDPLVDDPLLKRLRSSDTPVVTTGRVLGDGDTGCWVDNDHVAGAELMLQHLEEAGASHIALLTGPPVASYTHDCIASYEAWCAEHQREPDVVIPRGRLSEAAGFEATRELLDGDEPPDAIYATLDRMAIGALRAARLRGVGVPDDLLIGSHTDGDAVSWTHPRLTALALHPEAIGNAAVDMLATLIEGEEPVRRQVTIDSQVVVRGSTDRAPVDASAEPSQAGFGPSGAG